MPISMLAEFALRMAGGLAAILLITSWRLVPPAFFRTHCQIILALLVLAALNLAGGEAARITILLTVAAAAGAFFGSILWGLGLPRLAVPVTAAVAALAGAVLVEGSWHDGPVFVLNAASRLASAVLIGATLSAMLLGHHYLTAPAMSIDPLRKFVAAIGISLGVRIVLAALAIGVWLSAAGPAYSAGSVALLFLGMRWLVGIAGTGLAAFLAYRTVQIRSTQSATGILYIGMMLVLFGELSSMALARSSGLVF